MSQSTNSIRTNGVQKKLLRFYRCHGPYHKFKAGKAFANVIITKMSNKNIYHMSVATVILSENSAVCTELLHILSKCVTRKELTFGWQPNVIPLYRLSANLIVYTPRDISVTSCMQPIKWRCTKLCLEKNTHYNYWTLFPFPQHAKYKQLKWTKAGYLAAASSRNTFNYPRYRVKF